MQKFTVFTIILTIVVIVVVTEMVANRYLEVDSESSIGLELPLPKSLDLSKTLTTDVLGSDGSGLDNRLGADVEVIAVEEEPVVRVEDEPIERLPSDGLPIDGVPVQISPTESASGLPDFEDANPIAYTPNAFLREEQIRSAGFINAYLEDEEAGGLLFKTIQVDDIYDTKVSKYVIRTEDTLMAKVYVFEVGIDNTITEVYEVLKARASNSLDAAINETNEYGAASFYMNDLRRSGSVFLTARIGAFIYAFSYPKEYHSQVKNLIQLIEWELG